MNVSKYSVQIIQIPIDHYNTSDTQTYATTYHRPGDLVFYFDSGEQNAHPLQQRPDPRLESDVVILLRVWLLPAGQPR